MLCLVLGEACLTSVCLRGSVRTADPAVLVGVASRDDLLEPPPTGLDTAVVVRLVATVCFLPLGSVRVSVSAPLLAASRLSSAFLVAKIGTIFGHLMPDLSTKDVIITQ